MSRDHALKTAAALSRLWDASPTDRWRAGDGVVQFPGRRLSLHLMAQPVAAASFLSDPVLNGQGLLARCLVTHPSSAIGTRTRTEHHPQSDIEIRRFADKIEALLHHPLPLKTGTRNELAAPLLPLHPEARTLLQLFCLHIEGGQAAGKALENLRPVASKIAEHAARLAAVCTVFADPDATEIRPEIMSDAIRLAQYYLHEAQRLSDAAGLSQQTADAARMLKWLTDRWTEPLISAADAAQRGPFKETEKARGILRTLERAGWLRRVEGGRQILERRRHEVWEVHRGSES